MLSYHTINFVLLDFDITGVRMANYLRKKYPVIVLFLTNGRYGTKDYGAKDFSDYVKKYGVEAGDELIEEVISHYRETLDNLNKQNYNLLKWISL